MDKESEPQEGMKPYIDYTPLMLLWIIIESRYEENTFIVPIFCENNGFLKLPSLSMIPCSLIQYQCGKQPQESDEKIVPVKQCAPKIDFILITLSSVQAVSRERFVILHF